MLCVILGGRACWRELVSCGGGSDVKEERNFERGKEPKRAIYSYRIECKGSEVMIHCRVVAANSM